MARVRMTLSPAATPPEGTLRVIEVPVEALVFVPRVLTKPIEGQTGGGPPTQSPPLHVSFVVQALPSSQGRVLFAWAQPVAGLQESVVQTLPSSQLVGAPPAQAPPLQASPEVQALPASQPAGGRPLQIPPLHVSPVVHTLPSSQAGALFACVQPVAGLQESSVQTLPSLQLAGGPPAQAPPLQASPEVQALPSLQGR